MKAVAFGVLATMARPTSAKASPGVLAPTGRVPAADGVLTRLPGDGNLLALTVDDGASTEVVSAFAAFCRDSGTRLTFFVNGANASWSANARTVAADGRLRPGPVGQPHLVASLSHPDQRGRGRRSDPAEQGLPAEHLRCRRHPVLPSAVRRAHRRDRQDRGRPRLSHDHVVERDGRRLTGDQRAAADRLRPAGVRRSADRARPRQSAADHPHVFATARHHCRAANLQTVTLNDVFG